MQKVLEGGWMGRYASYMLAKLCRAGILLFALLVVACGEKEQAPAEQPADGAPVADAGPVDPYRSLKENAGSDVVEVNETESGTKITIFPRSKGTPKIQFEERGLNLGVELDPSRTMTAQLGDLRRMVGLLDRAFGDGGLYGRLHVPLDHVSYPVFVERMAGYASTDQTWKDNKKANPKWPSEGELHGYIVGWGWQKWWYGELNDVFSSVGRWLVFHDVSQCVTERPGADSEIGRWLASRGIEAQTAVPAGCKSGEFNIERQPRI